jgi:hypothetical protein
MDLGVPPRVPSGPLGVGSFRGSLIAPSSLQGGVPHRSHGLPVLRVRHPTGTSRLRPVGRFPFRDIGPQRHRERILVHSRSLNEVHIAFRHVLLSTLTLCVFKLI